jgi:hypothetical protein
MHDTLSEMPIIEWLRERFGIEDEDELRAVLADPSEMLALLDIAQAAGQDAIPSVSPRAALPV